jgi:hypothetical protein
MAINYDSLPSVKPESTVPAGFYKAKIIKAEMRTSKNTGAEYLSLQYDLNNGTQNVGKLFDMQFDSEKEFLRYKLQRFLTALRLDLRGTFELKDLCKLVNNKEIIVDVGIEEAKDGNPARNVINSFEHEIYYPINDWASLTGQSVVDDNANALPIPTDADAPIAASDALDNMLDSSPEEY